MIDLAPFSGIAQELAKTLVTGATGLLRSHVQQARTEASNVERYLREITNRVGYLTAYRPAAQTLDAAYVRPTVIDFVLSQHYLSPEEVERILKAIGDQAQEQTATAAEAEHMKKVLDRLAPEQLSDAIPTIHIVTHEQLVSAYPHALVLAEPGSGKSSFLSYLCLSRLRAKKPRLPIYLESRHLRTQSLASAVEENLAKIGLSDRGLTHLADRIALYVDGLDELPSDQYKSICLEIGEMRRSSPALEIVVACRSAAYRGELSFLPELSLLPFDKRRIEQFVTSCFADFTTGPDATDLIKLISSNDRISELSAQPLLLALICNAYRRYLDISRRQSTLFEQCVNALIWQWDADRQVKRHSLVTLDLQKLVSLHIRIAVVLHQERLRLAPNT